MSSIDTVCVGVVWRGDPHAAPPSPADTRLFRIFEELAARGVNAVPVIYADKVSDVVRHRLLGLDGAVVWVDPIMQGQDRSLLDALLREVAAAGVFVSAHPDVILKMGTKEVLHRTRAMAWGTDTRLYRSEPELLSELPRLLRSGGPRVLKQSRGSSGNGVWKVELVTDANPVTDAVVRVQHGTRGAVVEEIFLGTFAQRCREYFDAFSGTGCLIDQPYADKAAEGMIRCYLVHDRVVGFGHQRVTALTPPPVGQDGPPDPPPRRYCGPSKPEFQHLKGLLETEWVAEMQQLLDIETEHLPVIWDADFLLGPKTSAGDDTYMLCEINASSVFPLPEEAIGPLADATVERTRTARRRRRTTLPL